jgi:[acyl-carrier-protein] S-malonyltransferase|tara:strand:+ start:3384 stop:4247 length:864 start_codon:yes stop_codon:yes gene_type:complete
MKAILFPGQGSQYVGMGKDLYESSDLAKKLFNLSNSILGFDITDVMFNGSQEDLKKTDITQPAIFIHSTILFNINSVNADAYAGHSLGEFSALLCSGSLTFEDALKLVLIRARAMEKACKNNETTMAAILGLDDTFVNSVCDNISNVVPANYNCPGQIVISGSKSSIDKACESIKEIGGKTIVLPVGGAFHSFYMESAKKELEDAIKSLKFNKPDKPIYQNFDANPHIDIEKIKKNLINQLTSPVLWKQTINKLIADNYKSFIECGPGRVLQGLVKKINRDMDVSSI